MPIPLILFAAFVTVPIVELMLLIKLGGYIGVLSTIALVIVTAAIGTWMLRQQGLAVLFRAQTAMNEGRMPAQEMAEGLILAVGGVLLLTPGFITDAIGLCCLMPFTRAAIAAGIAKRMVVMTPGGSVHPGRGQSGNVIEGEVVSEDEPDK